MSRKHVVYSLIGVVALLMTACGTPAGQPPAPDATPPAADTTEESRDLPPQAVLDAQLWLAEQQGVSVEQVTIVEMEQQDWPDSCLGLGGPAESCAAVITPGWRVILEIDGQQYEVRTDESGETVRLATSTG